MADAGVRTNAALPISSLLFMATISVGGLALSLKYPAFEVRALKARQL